MQALRLKKAGLLMEAFCVGTESQSYNFRRCCEALRDRPRPLCDLRDLRLGADAPCDSIRRCGDKLERPGNRPEACACNSYEAKAVCAADVGHCTEKAPAQTDHAVD
jgi:hypothetical protein